MGDRLGIPGVAGLFRRRSQCPLSLRLLSDINTVAAGAAAAAALDTSFLPGRRPCTRMCLVPGGLRLGGGLYVVAAAVPSLMLAG